eukprot:Clim_evm6s201 gene=Clim_evmTU6s201
MLRYWPTTALATTSRGSSCGAARRLFSTSTTMTPRVKPRAVVLGSGWAGFRASADLDSNKYDVTLISPRNHFLFTPLLPSTSTGTLEFRAIAEPVRQTLQNPGSYQRAYAVGIDPERKIVRCSGWRDGEDRIEYDTPFDKLVIAVGARSNTFNIPGVSEHAHFLKELAHARAIRRHLIENFESAALPCTTEKDKKRLLHFVVVGAGPTGIEFAAELNDFVKQDLDRVFPNLKQYLKITVVEAGKQVLAQFSDGLVNYTLKHFQRQDIEVRLGTAVTEVRKDQILLNTGEVLNYGLCVWSTGLEPRPVIGRLDWEKDRVGRLVTDNKCRVLEHPDVYAIGDCAVIQGYDLPPTAQVAEAKAIYVAKSLNKLVDGQPQNQIQAFEHSNRGMMAYIGDYRGLADLGDTGVKASGPAAWFLWRAAYFTKQVSIRNKILIPFQWFKTFVFGRDVSRF